MILRLFMFCYEALYYDFMNGEEELNDEHIMKICFGGLEEIKKSVTESIELEEDWATFNLSRFRVMLQED